MDKFKIEPHKNGWEKSFEIITPESWAITLIVDYDDVDHKRVDKEAKKIVDILNNNSIPLDKPVKVKLAKTDIETLDIEARKFLLDNKCDDLVLNNRPFNKGNYLYASNIMVKFISKFSA